MTTRGSCHWCGAVGERTRDHIAPSVFRGQDSARNLVPACHSCQHERGVFQDWYGHWLDLAKFTEEYGPTPSEDQQAKLSRRAEITVSRWDAMAELVRKWGPRERAILGWSPTEEMMATIEGLFVEQPAE